MNNMTKVQTDPVSQLEAALASALPLLEGAKKNSTNPHFKNKYADLGAVIEAIRPMAEQGVWFRQVLHEGAEGVTVETLYTGFGATISAGTLFMPAGKRDAQGFGSALTYARRYALQTAFGLSAEDDDGQAGSKAPAKDAAPQLIGEGQYSEIIGLMEKTATDAGKFCAAFGIASVKELPTEAFTRAKQQLTRKLAQMEPVDG
jgi:hypothetical protein